MGEGAEDSTFEEICSIPLRRSQVVTIESFPIRGMSDPIVFRASNLAFVVTVVTRGFVIFTVVSQSADAYLVEDVVRKGAFVNPFAQVFSVNGSGRVL